MLKDKFIAVAEYPAMKKVLAFFDGYYYPAVYAALALISSIFGLEIPFFILTVLAAVFVCLFAKDTRSLFVPVAVMTMGRSWKHASFAPYNSDFMSRPYVIAVLCVLGAVAFAALLWRVIVWRGEHNFFKDKSAYKWSIVAMTAVLLLNGVFYSGWIASDLLLGLLYAVSFFGLYIFFFNTLERREGTAKYVAVVLFAALCLILLQIGWIFAFEDAVQGGSINKDRIITGWGVSNNIGARIAIYLPACFYMSMKFRRGWIFYVSGFVFFGSIFLTLSRTSVLMGAIALVCMAVYLSIVKTPCRKFIRIFNIACVAGVIVLAAIFWDKIQELFAVFFERGVDDSGRFEIWESGLKNFLRAPVFGVGFYEPIMPGVEMIGMFPEMYHNIFVQMLASCGIVGFAAFVFQIVQFARVVFRKGVTVERLFFVMVILVILATNLLDVHLFLPTISVVYSVFLLFAELAPAKAKPSEGEVSEKGETVREESSPAEEGESARAE